MTSSEQHGRFERVQPRTPAATPADRPPPTRCFDTAPAARGDVAAQLKKLILGVLVGRGDSRVQSYFHRFPFSVSLPSGPAD
jgi:hypothetical protein